MNGRLVDANLECLSQVRLLLASIDNRQYTEAPAAMPDQRAGAHLRHVLEFYECFLEGLDAGVVDYDARRRDPAVAEDRCVALDRIGEIEEALRRCSRMRLDTRIAVRSESHDAISSLSRELQVLASHSVHHFALIGFVLRLNGVEVPPEFGVAPSTLHYRALAGAA